MAYEFFDETLMVSGLSVDSHWPSVYVTASGPTRSVNTSPFCNGRLLSSEYTLSSCLLLTLNDSQFQPSSKLKYCMKLSPPLKRTGVVVPRMASFSNLMVSGGVSTISRPVLYCHRRKFSVRPLA